MTGAPSRLLLPPALGGFGDLAGSFADRDEIKLSGFGLLRLALLTDRVST
jgi:hypothetical protein